MSALIRHIRPVRPERARGLVAEVYAQVNAEYSSIGPAVMMMSPSDELMAAGWSLMRESQLAAGVPLLDKAVVALGVALAIGLPYEVHTMREVVRRLGGPDIADAVEHTVAPGDGRLGALLAWAVSTGSEEPVEAPFGDGERAEIIGTVVFTHFINRVAAAMLPPGLTPGSLSEDEPPAFEDAPVLREPVRNLAPGATLPLLKGLPAGEEPGWAEGSPIGAAFAALSACARQGAALLSPGAAELAVETIAAYGGLLRPVGAWLDEALAPLPEDERKGARVVVLAGLAPDELTDEDVAAWRATDRRFSDHCTVYLLAFGAMAAAEQIAAALHSER
ncbi:DNA-binding protein [Nonomuraea typhae]|uniref:DNA-binding protein n=1 Tax=Nonomuraea typhae TaxID=2603600 RepID=UPI0012FAD560|nr:DNA-binding protein [Nonomuraea typhae]